MNLQKVLIGLLFVLAATPSASQERPWCSTSSPLPEQAPWFANLVRQARQSVTEKATIRVPIAFHALTDGKNGKLTLGQVQTVVDNLNWAYRDTPFSFYLYSLDTTKNAGWFKNCYFNAKNQQKLRKRLAKDVRYFVNVYSCRLGLPGWYGIATFPPGYPIPGTPGPTYMQGIAIDPVTLGGSSTFEYGLALAHEMGHYLGLFHTFEKVFNPGQTECSEPGDLISDTPAQAGHTLGACPVGRDSCPASPGADPIANFMNYATDACWDNFSAEQVDLMLYALEQARPTLGTR